MRNQFKERHVKCRLSLNTFMGEEGTRGVRSELVNRQQLQHMNVTGERGGGEVVDEVRS